MSEIEPLANCPFCISDNLLETTSEKSGKNHILCVNCMGRGPLMDTPLEAIKAWNTRQDDKEKYYLTAIADLTEKLNGQERLGLRVEEVYSKWQANHGIVGRTPTLTDFFDYFNEHFTAPQGLKPLSEEAILNVLNNKQDYEQIPF